MTSIRTATRGLLLILLCLLVTSQASAVPPVAGTPTPRTMLRAKLIKPTNGDPADRYSRGMLSSKETGRVKQISISARALFAVQPNPDPTLPGIVPEVTIDVPQASGGSVRCTLAARIGAKDPATQKNLVHVLLKAIARKKTLNNQPIEIYKATKGGCASDVVPVFPPNSTAVIKIGDVPVLTGLVK